LPSQTENTDHPSTLPPEELNPLINPLLAQNMGRWAEVYFTNLPENRDQAVMDLLDELRAQAPPPENPAPIAAPVPVEVAAWQAADAVQAVLCPQCGYENRSDHNFCGACRAQLRGEAGAFLPSDSDPGAHAAELELARPANLAAQSIPRDIGRENSQDNAYDSFDYRETVSDRRSDDLRSDERQTDRRQDYDRRDRDDDDRRDESKRNGGAPSDYSAFRFSSVPDSPRRPYRVYAGLAIAVVLAFLLYRAWSGEHAGAAGSHVAPQLPPAPVTETAGPATTAAQPNLGASSAAPAAASTTASAIQPKTETASRTVPNETTPAKPSAQTSAPATETPALSANGAAELALAKSYLNGTDGKERNPAEAADLLWKAVSKQNAEATDLLSDLYLKGDGVQKNCDQARVLLDAAASKGRKDAAERLGHLEAFGCQ
jgi:hypothetical protein